MPKSMIDEELLQERYNQLVDKTKQTWLNDKDRWGKQNVSDAISFRDGLWAYWEGGKQETRCKAISELHLSEWSGPNDERILKEVNCALGKTVSTEAETSYGFLSYANAEAATLVFNEPKSGIKQKASELIFRLFTTTIDEQSDKEIFDKLANLFVKVPREKYHSFPVVSYLFFMKDGIYEGNNYIQVRPVRFQENLQKLDARIPLGCSWRNYRLILDMMRQIEAFLKTRFPNEDISLIDAQSFFWMLWMI